MVSVEEALQLVEKKVASKGTMVIPVSDALGYVLATDVPASINMPPFRQSAMDGYAVRMHEKNTYEVIGEIKAGDGDNPQLRSGEGVRIFTGAPVPDDADAVIIQEWTTVEKDRIEVDGEVKKNANIREEGEQIGLHMLAAARGTLMRPAAVGFLASLGIAKISVYEKPSIGIIVTGNELQPPGVELERGQIYESNGAMLEAALRQVGFEDVSIHKVPDTYSETVLAIGEVLEDNDVVLISGGISVGDYDFVGKALEELGVTEIFYKVKQKPGKPLFMGVQGDKTVFALPGNPASALSCFYVYALPALYKISGRTDFHLERRMATATNTFRKRGDRPQFLKALVSGNEVTILDGQASSMIHTFSVANALAYMEEDNSEIKKGDNVEVIMLPST